MGKGATWLFVGKFIGGRFLAYLGVGLLVGLLGSHLGAWGQRLGLYASLVLALVLIGYGLGVRVPHLGVCQAAGKMSGQRWFPFVLGSLTGFNVCPPFLLAITYSLQNTADAMYGMLFFLAFFAATTLYILPLGMVGHLPRRDLMVTIGRAASVGVGVYFLYQSISALRLL